MPAPLPSPDRRRLLATLASLPLLGRVRHAAAASPLGITPAPAEATFPDGAAMLVAGPNGGAMDRWAHVLQPALAPALAPGLILHTSTAGGPDGVTGANQFDARVVADGRTVLLTPGEAALDWLVGDPRAQFDVGHWVPVMACIAPGVVVGRVAAFSSPGTVRIAAAHPTGHALPAILGIELLGSRAQLVPNAVERGTIEAAFAHNKVDAVLLRGHKVPEQVAALTGPGIQPIFSLGARNESGALVRSPDFPDTPTLPELYAGRRGALVEGPMREAWCAAAAASQLEFGLVLPQLTPAAMVALWRHASAEAAGTLDVQSAALALSVRVLGGSAAPACTTPAAASQPALLALRKWLLSRFNWRPA